MDENNGDKFLKTLTLILYSIICMIGIIGNATVIYVILSISSITPASLFNMTSANETKVNNIELQPLREKKSIMTKKSLLIQPSNIKKQTICQRVFKRLKALKLSVTNYYLINLAIADFLLLFFIIFLIPTVIMERWIFGLILCKIYFSLTYMCQLNAAFIICILSFDRWLAVRFPLKVKNYRNLFITKIIIFLSWTISAILSIPVIMFTKINSHDLTSNETSSSQNLFCQIDIDNNITNHSFLPTGFSPLKAFQFYWLTINFILPVSFIVIFYLQVLRLLKLNSKNSRLNQSMNKIRVYKKITIMCLAIIGCYVICWTPYWIVQLLLTVKADYADHSTFRFILSMTQIIAYLNSALNPILYSFLSEDFQSNFRIACCVCNKK